MSDDEMVESEEIERLRALPLVDLAALVQERDRAQEDAMEAARRAAERQAVARDTLRRRIFEDDFMRDAAAVLAGRVWYLESGGAILRDRPVSILVAD